MKFLFRSGWGESVGVARRVASEGHDVLFSIAREGGAARAVGDGLVDKINDFGKGVAWADIIIFDGNTFNLPKEAEEVRKTKPVIGSSSFADRLEHDRPFAIRLVKAAGIRVPDYIVFEGKGAFQRAREFLSGQDGPWVFKPDRDVPIRTHVSKNTEEMFLMMDYFEERFKEEGATPDFLLEDRVEGIEVSTEGWWNGSDFYCVNSTLEKNRLFDHDLGEMTGCAGNVVWAYPNKAPLFNKLLKPLIPAIGDKYRGPIDVNAIIDEDTKEPYFLEFSPRFGYSAIFAFLELVDNAGDFFAAVAMGQTPPRVKTDRFSIGVRVSIPPYPTEAPGVAMGYPVMGFDIDEVNPHISPCEIRVDEDGRAYTTGPDGLVFEITNQGGSIAEARSNLYETVRQIWVPNMRYRTDIGIDAAGAYQELQELGLLGKERR